MPYYNVFCIFCSVRLGSIVVGILSFISVVVMASLVVANGSNWFGTTAKNVEEYIRENKLDDRYLSNIKHIEKNKDTYFIVLTTLQAIYMVTCVLEVIGAFLINKWLLLPFIIMEFFRLVSYLAFFCMILIVIKKAINLGLLIMFSILGTFTLLMMFYLWACVLSLFQIIFIVNSSEYRSLYGDNPLKPPSKSIPNQSSKTAKIEKVKFFPSPNFNKGADKLKASPIIDKYDQHPFGIGQSRRIQNEYNDMRRNYLNQSHYGHEY